MKGLYMDDSIEYEAKVLNIDVDNFRAILKEQGAKKVNQLSFQRYVFDTIPKHESRWVRLRGDGQHTTLTVKEITSSEIDGTNEWEVTVSDINIALKILEKIGIQPRGYQENTREEYELDGVEISIDHWPKLKPYIEIEGSSREEVVKTAEKLGFSESNLVTDNTEVLYQRIGIDIKTTADLRFDDPPAL